MNATPESLPLTASQTVGPFFSGCLLRDDRSCTATLVTPDTEGTRINIEGHVYDGDGQPVPDAMIEIWQADAAGRYNYPSAGVLAPDATFTGAGRCGTDDRGSFLFETIKPGAVPFDAQQMQAPHICVTVFARGLLNHLYTRLYFTDESANEHDPILLLVPEERRATLLAQPTHGDGVTTYRFDIVLQGAGETVFFNI
jgi:protocatechuate 3,4-dioxygenase, alpha subunit